MICSSRRATLAAFLVFFMGLVCFALWGCGWPINIATRAQRPIAPDYESRSVWVYSHEWEDVNTVLHEQYFFVAKPDGIVIDDSPCPGGGDCIHCISLVPKPWRNMFHRVPIQREHRYTNASWYWPSYLKG